MTTRASLGRDIPDASFSGIRSGIEDLREEMLAEIGALGQRMGTEIGELRGRMSTEIGELGGRVSTEIGALRGRMSTEIGALKEGIQGITTYLKRLETLQIYGIIQQELENKKMVFYFKSDLGTALFTTSPSAYHTDDEVNERIGLIVHYLLGYPDFHITLEGHTNPHRFSLRDAKTEGDRVVPTTEEGRSLARAEEIKNKILRSIPIPDRGRISARITPIGRGSLFPQQTGKHPLNCRVNLTVRRPLPPPLPT
ncbi:MAG TPA: hypothetical protein PKW79_06870 [Rhabdochlamydiaceae bacterium]|nr:hypothetical protein [Rhabdochlamydiaceae bacterium]